MMPPLPRLSELPGHAAVGRGLARALAGGRLPPALLFCGPSGSGRELAALALAGAITCETPRAGEACGGCRSCRRVGAGFHPDVTVIRPEGAFLKLEQVHELLARARMRPFEGRGQALILADAERMTAEAANALLKSLEEPPADVHWILIAPSPAALLPTIASRCVPVLFHGSGTAGTAEPPEAAEAALTAALAGRWPEAYGWAREQGRERDQAERAVHDLGLVLRDRALAACRGPAPSDPNSTRATAGGLDRLGAFEAARLSQRTAELAELLRRNANATLLLEAFLLEIARSAPADRAAITSGSGPALPAR